MCGNVVNEMSGIEYEANGFSLGFDFRSLLPSIQMIDCV